MFYLFFFNYPFFNITGFRTEIYSYFKEFPFIHLERKSVMLVIYLLQCFFCRTVQFKFHDIDEFVCLQDKVDASFACMIFHFGIEADQFKNDEKHVLVMQFLIANHFVGGICKEALQATEERTVIAGGVPEHIAYSMSDGPLGPWKYMGEIMPLQDTGSFTNHCGVIDYKGNSYFFYHTGKLPGGGGFGRSAAVEQFKYNADSTFPIINATREGVSPVGMLNPYERVEAETIAFSEGVKSEPKAKTGIYISEIHNGDYIKVREVDFGNKSPKRFTATVASALRGGTLEVRTDSISGPLIAELTIPSTGGWECWKTLQTDIVKPVTGIQDIYFVFKGRKGCKLFNFDWYKFNR